VNLNDIMANTDAVVALRSTHWLLTARLALLDARPLAPEQARRLRAIVAELERREVTPT
jgi:hypothetical protein